ncbi:MAG TPA: hypothetical protein DCQ64_00815 [Candidatus Rokubacteria bacterium]|nr:hypothetical protein [Candidatus Rokubacteria bacterium]
MRRTATHTPQSVKQLAGALPAAAWRTVRGAKGRAARCARASRGCACGPPIAMSSARSPGRRSGC